jgi:hypothetical protein
VNASHLQRSKSSQKICRPLLACYQYYGKTRAPARSNVATLRNAPKPFCSPFLDCQRKLKNGLAYIGEYASSWSSEGFSEIAGMLAEVRFAKQKERMERSASAAVLASAKNFLNPSGKALFFASFLLFARFSIVF